MFRFMALMAQGGNSTLSVVWIGIAKRVILINAR
jgi:hypothetical protein